LSELPPLQPTPEPSLQPGIGLTPAAPNRPAEAAKEASVSTSAFEAWLQRLETLDPSRIRLGLERVAAVAVTLGLGRPAPTVITVAGTNGKGSTCAMLEAILRAGGFRTGLYTSPHLLRFEERARIEGVSVSPAALVEQFEAVEQARCATREATSESGEPGETVELTYFEFTTLAILRLFEQAKLDVAILEVGLGGRLDAVNWVDADCSIVTCIDIDHAALLGSDRESIGREKAAVFRSGRPAIVADPVPPASVIAYAHQIGADLWQFGQDFNYAGDRQQWGYGGRVLRRNSLAYPALRGANQLINASAALAALEALRDRLPIPAQAIREGLACVELPGRFQVLPGRPTVVLDVGHNPHAAAHLAVNLDQMGYHPFTWAVVGMLRDKDVDGVIQALASRVDHWIPVDLPGPRGASAEWLAERLRAMGVTEGAQSSIAPHASPREGLAAARQRAGPDDRILVFGSFLTVADVLAHR
jgi:dihydrofolate synthase/folylpolyglutamate synthase